MTETAQRSRGKTSDSSGFFRPFDPDYVALKHAGSANETASLVERHITRCATEDLLCGRPHNSSIATRQLRPRWKKSRSSIWVFQRQQVSRGQNTNQAVRQVLAFQADHDDLEPTRDLMCTE